jgi:IPT/TIG domain
VSAQTVTKGEIELIPFIGQPRRCLQAVIAVARCGVTGGGKTASMIRVAAAAATVLFAASGVTPVQAAPFAIPPGTPHACIGLDAYRSSSATRALCHVRTIPLSAVTTRRDGGHNYEYELNGSPITFVVPPAGFNAVTASQSEREAYGIPSQPPVTDTAAHDRWEEEIHSFHPSAPPKALYQPVLPATTDSSSALTSELTPQGPTVKGANKGSLTSTTRGGCLSCWAGYADTGELKGIGPKVPPFTAAGIVYKEPQRLDDCEGAHASPWVGMGGDGSEPLDQAGTGLGKGAGIAEHQVWIENYEEPVEKEDYAIPLEFYATPGGEFQILVTYDGGNYYTVSYYNFATGTSYGPITRKSRKTYKGLSAEYIMERPDESPLADFGKWEVAEAWAQGNHTDGPEAFEHEALTIYAGKRRVASTSGLSYPETGREFYVNWEGYSESNTCYPEDPAPSVTTEAAAEVQETSAVLRGSVDPNNGETHYYFEYGTTTAYGNKVPLEPGEDIGSGSTFVAVSKAVSGLKQGTEYHYRVVASNDQGTSFGSDQTFRTLVSTPSAVISSNGTEYVYFRGENGQIWQATPSTGSVIELRGTAAVGSPAAVALSSGERDVYFDGTNGSIWRWYFNPSTEGWKLEEIGGTTAGVPAVAAGDPHTVFFRQETGCQKCIYQLTMSSKGSWNSPEALGGSAAGNPTAVANAAGEEQVFWTENQEGPNTGGISEWYQASGKWNFARVGGTPTAEKPAVVLYPSGKESVYFQAREGCIQCEDQMYWNGSSWATQWGSGQLAGGPVAMPESESSQRSYWRGTDGDIWYNHGEAAHYPFAPVLVGGSVISNLSEIYNPGGSVTTSLYYVEGNGGLMDLYSQSGEWHFKQVCAWPCGEQGEQPPQVRKVTPSSGSGVGGTKVTLQGTYFTEVESVKFGSAKAESFTVNSSTSITAIAPPEVGTVNVTVTTPQGTSAITSENNFYYSAYTTTARPSAVLLPNGSEDVYYRGENGGIWQATSYGAVTELGGKAQGNPVAVATSSGEQDVYFTGTNGAVWRWYYYPGSGWSLSEIGGSSVAGDPTVASAYPTGVFYRQSEGCQKCIYESWLSGSSWQTAALGGSASGDPLAVMLGAEEQVFWPENHEGAGTGGISEWRWDGKEWHFARIGGTPTAEKPAVALHTDGTESVYFRAREGCISCIDQLYWNGSKWETQWIGGDAAGVPVTADEGDSYASVYWRGSDSEMWDNYGNPTYPGSEWNFDDFGGHMAGDPAEVHSAGAPITTSLYYIDQTGGLTDQYQQNGEWHTKQMCAWPCSAQNPAAPAVSVLPQLSTSAPKQGIPLTTTSGTWSGEPTITYAYQWVRCNSSGEACTNISGATSSGYTPVSADVEHTLRVTVTATNAGGHTAATSTASSVVPAGAPTNTALPTISPTTPHEGTAETTTTGSWTNSPTSYAYQWERCNESGKSCTNISGATNASYTPVTADVGHTLVAQVTATNTDGAGLATSAATGVVTGKSYTQTIDSGNSLNGVSCIPSTTDCAVSDSKGNAFYATNVSTGSSATWTSWKGPAESASDALDCPASSLCLLADGGNLDYATSLGGSWSQAYAPSYGVDAISCASSSFCVDGQNGDGYFRYTTSPASTSWTLEDQGSASMNGVSCVSSSFCAMVSSVGDVYVADTTTQIESSSWTATDVDGSSALHGVACTSTTSCLAVDGAGNVLKLAISEGKATTTKQNIDASNDLTAITCTGGSVCVAVDSAGNIFTTTNGGTSWTKEYTTGTDLTSVSCASTSLCAAADTTGKVTSLVP